MIIIPPCVTGGRICLRLHVLARGLSQLIKQGDGESVGRCLERLHNSVEQIRRGHNRQKATEVLEVRQTVITHVHITSHAMLGDLYASV
jgi:hypothetical protein